MSRLVVVGDVILDRDLLGDVRRVCPDAPVPVLDLQERVERPGGAGLAAALLARSGGHHEVQLVACTGADADGALVRRLLAGHGVELIETARSASTRSVSRVRGAGQSLLRIDAGVQPLSPRTRLETAAAESALAAADAVLVCDYGGGVVAHPRLRQLVARSALRRPLVWDPHPRGGAPVTGSTVVTPNRTEVGTFAERLGLDPATRAALDLAAAALRDAWQVHAVAATDGANGVFTALTDSPALFTPTPFVHPGDSCGAGDRFAGTLAAALAAGGVITEAVGTAVTDVAAWLARGGVAVLTSRDHDDHETGHDHEEARRSDGWQVAAAIRASGGTLVATGGCFDVVHAGHVATLQAARRLGDGLVVLLNSDAAVRRLKGPTRPVHPVADRIAVLSSLACVDAVIVFDEDTPVNTLERLRPQVWAKGGDYAAATLPEAALVHSWGGRVILLPYLPGRSTTGILTRPREQGPVNGRTHP